MQNKDYWLNSISKFVDNNYACAMNIACIRMGFMRFCMVFFLLIKLFGKLKTITNTQC